MVGVFPHAVPRQQNGRGGRKKCSSKNCLHHHVTPVWCVPRSSREGVGCGVEVEVEEGVRNMAKCLNDGRIGEPVPPGEW